MFDPILNYSQIFRYPSLTEHSQNKFQIPKTIDHIEYICIYIFNVRGNEFISWNKNSCKTVILRTQKPKNIYWFKNIIKSNNGHIRLTRKGHWKDIWLYKKLLKHDKKNQHLNARNAYIQLAIIHGNNIYLSLNLLKFRKVKLNK